MRHHAVGGDRREQVGDEQAPERTGSQRRRDGPAARAGCRGGAQRAPCGRAGRHAPERQQHHQRQHQQGSRAEQLVRHAPIVGGQQDLRERRQHQHARTDGRVGQRHDGADATGEPARQQRRGDDHAERSGSEPAEQAHREQVVPQLGGKAGEQIAGAEADEAEGIGDARAQAIDQLACERRREAVGQHVDGVGERDVGAGDAQALLHRQQEDRERLGHAAGNQIHGKGEDDDGDEERACSLLLDRVLGLCHASGPPW